jgi:hypothetical protein
MKVSWIREGVDGVFEHSKSEFKLFKWCRCERELLRRISEHRLLKKRVGHIQTSNFGRYINMICRYMVIFMEISGHHMAVQDRLRITFSLTLWLPSLSLCHIFKTLNLSHLFELFEISGGGGVCWTGDLSEAHPSTALFSHICSKLRISHSVQNFKSFTRFRTSNLTHFVQIFEFQEAEECVGPEICLKHIQPKALSPNHPTFLTLLQLASHVWPRRIEQVCRLEYLNGHSNNKIKYTFYRQKTWSNKGISLYPQQVCRLNGWMGIQVQT